VFEGALEDALTHCTTALGLGDTVERVGRTAAPGATGKKGDIVVHVRTQGTAPVTLVVEAKSLTRKPSSREWARLSTPLVPSEGPRCDRCR
jgi:hypothetical protein